MFNFNKKPKTNEAGEKVDDLLNGPKAAEFLINESDIHTMPKKSPVEKKPNPYADLPGGGVSDQPKKQKKSGQINWLFLGILAFIVLGGLITVIIIFYTTSYKKEQQINSAENTDIENTNAPAPTLNNNAQINENTNGELLKTPSERDQQRIDDINIYKNALSDYFGKNSSYPGSLDQLISEFIDALPKNPTPGGKDYAYTTNGENNSSYQLTFTLEEGAVYNTINLTSGDYQLTPEGVGLVTITNDNQNGNTNNDLQPPITPIVIQSATDSDNDYLTDLEENFYQTDPAKADSDGDTYLDGVEVRNLYNPLAAESRLNETELILTYTNESYNYSVYYLKDWVVSAINNNNSEVMFTSSLGEFISILVQDNPIGLSSMDWYKQYLPVNFDFSALETVNISGLPAVKSVDGLHTYLAFGTKIYIINYNLGTNQEKVFETTYKMLLKSFTLTGLIN